MGKSGETGLSYDTSEREARRRDRVDGTDQRLCADHLQIFADHKVKRVMSS
jgi:hypothetical protein